VPVRVPVFGDSLELRFVLTAVIDADSFAELIRDQGLPPTWFSGLIDATCHFVGRFTALSPAYIASEVFRSAVRGSVVGWYR
jgi:hypothetical protein